MSAIAFPSMFTNIGTTVVTQKAETMQNLKLLLASEKGELYGDPLFGTKLRQIFFSQATTATKEIVADEISRAISTFMPQLRCPTNYIEFVVDDTSLAVKLSVINILNYTQDIYTITLLQV